MQFLEKIKKSIFSLIILILLIISFFVFKFALQKEKIYSPKMSENQIFTHFEVFEKLGKVSLMLMPSAQEFFFSLAKKKIAGEKSNFAGEKSGRWHGH